MASPSVVGTPAETAISTASTSHTVNLPSGAAGNLLIAVMSKGSAGTTPTVNALAGWNELLDEAQTLGLYIAWRTCDGTEGATTTFTLSSSTRGAWIVYEITGHIDPTTQAPQVGTTATGSGTTPDPPSVSVTGGSKDILTIACFGRDGEEADDDTWVTSAPSGFGGLLQKACGTAGTNLAGMIATAHLASTTATSNPGTFSAATGAWRAQTIVVHPPPPPTQTAVAEVSLGAGGTPTSQTAHSIKVRARTTAGAGTLKAALYEGATNRSGDIESSALTTSLADYTLAIPDASAANVTDYSNLAIRFWGYAAGGGSIVFEVDQLYLEIPASAAITKAGFGKAGADGHGADVMLDTETGRGVVGLVGAGVSASVAVETGFGTVGTVGSGVSAFVSGAGATHTKAGFATVGEVGSGADVDMAVESGRGVLGLAGSGANSVTSTETGRGIVGLVGSGTREETHARTGAGIVGLVGSGDAVIVDSEAGHGVVGAVGAGTSAFVDVESGFGKVGSVGSGVGSKAGQITKTGAGVVGPVGSGRDAMLDTERGAGIVSMVGAGVRNIVDTERGFGKVGGVGSGSSSATTVHIKAGFGKVGSVALGSRIRERSSTGHGTVGTIAAGTKLRVLTRDGHATLTLVGAGSRNSEYAETGYATVGSDGYGISDHDVFFTLLDVIYTGRIADGWNGSVDSGDQGHVADTVGGVMEEDVEEVFA